MSRRCSLTGKGPLVGNRVSHANNKTKHRQMPNVFYKRVYSEEAGRWFRIKLTARALRTINTKGLVPFLKSQGMTLDDLK